MSTVSAPYRPDLDSLGPRVAVTVSPAEPVAGQTVTVAATLTNDTVFTLGGAVLYLTRPDTSEPAHGASLGDLRPGCTATRRQHFTLAADAEGPMAFAAHALFDVAAHSCDFARATATVQLPYRSLGTAVDNAGISADAAVGAANLDASGSSLSAEALAAVGCRPGAVVSHDGVDFRWPGTRPGARDNVVSSGQSVLLTGAGTRLAFLGTSTWGEGRGEGAVHYADGTVQPFPVAVPDWYGAHPDAALVAPYRNLATGRDDTPVSLFAFSVPLAAGRPLRAVALPAVSPDLRAGVPALHVFAMTLA
jgi:hypothetical protein